MYELEVCAHCGYKKFVKNGTRQKKCTECGSNTTYKILCTDDDDDITDIRKLTPLESFLIWFLLIGTSLLIWIAVIKQIITLIW